MKKTSIAYVITLQAKTQSAEINVSRLMQWTLKQERPTFGDWVRKCSDEFIAEHSQQPTFIHSNIIES